MNNDRTSLMRPLLLLVAVLVALFAALAYMALTGVLAGLEGAVYRWAEGSMSPGFTAFMLLVTRIIDPAPVLMFCVLLLVVPATRSTVAPPVDAAAAAAFVINLMLKHIFARERPDILRMVEESSLSFPSAHAMVSAAMYVMLILLAFHYTKRASLRIAAALLLSLLILVIGFSRVYLGVHHAGDIVGGWLLGILIAAVLFHIWRRSLKIQGLLQRLSQKK